MEKSFQELGFEQIEGTPFAEIHVNRGEGIIACILLTDYVPIKNFQETFHQLGDEIKNGQYKKFIFDKRALRTFHQPSMAWYFLEWKTEMLNYGLKTHRKILPTIPWFLKAVEIARDPLIAQFSPEVREKLDIGYCNTFEESVWA